MKRSRQNLGRWGEEIAANYLVQQGYTILEHNARTLYGEIDIVTRQMRAAPGEIQNVTVFVEVKTRRSTSFGAPEDSITQQKRAHLLSSAQAYLQAHPELDGDWRIDVVAVRYLQADTSPLITHFENAFS